MKALHRIAVLQIFLLLPATLCLAQSPGGAPLSARNASKGEPFLTQSVPAPSEKSLERHQAALKVLTGGPLHFERNAGQFDSQVKFASRGIAHTLFLTSDEAVLVVTGQDGRAAGSRWPSGRRSFQRENLKQHVARLKLANANASPEIEGLDELPGRSNYLRGRDKNNWQTNVPHYSRVRYRDVYRGVDWVYYGNEGRLEYDFVVSPGTDPGQIALDVSMDEEAKDQAVRIDANGDLIISTDPQSIRFLHPVAFQMVEGQKQLVSANYVMRAPGRVGFELGPYDRSQPLVIDPVLTFSTYFGGSNGTAAFGVAVDASGIYIAGQTNSGDLPTTAGAVQEVPGTGTISCFSSVDPSPCFDAFVTKFTADGSGLVYSTFLGGSALDGAFGLAVDGSGQAVVVGGTYSSDFPTTDSSLTAFQADINGGAAAACQDSAGSTIDCEDAFVAVLNNAGTSLVYSTYVGGTGTDYASGAAVDASGNAYLTGFTDSDAASLQSTAGAPGGGTCTINSVDVACGDAFAGKFQYSPVAADPTASRVFLRFIGGTGDEFGNGIAVENSTGNVFVAGEADANTLGADAFTMVNGFQPSFQGAVDGFIAKLNSTGSIVYSSFLGGSSTDSALDIGLDSTGNAFVVGYTISSNFPVKNALTGQGARDSSNCANCFDAFLTKFDTGLTGANSLLFSTYFGGSGSEGAFGLAVDSSDNVFLAGLTSTPATGVTKPFPLMNPLQSAKMGTSNASDYDAFVSKLNNTGTTLLFSTYLGGTGDTDWPNRIATGPSGEVVAVGLTNSYDFPATLDSYQPYHYSVAGDDAFVVKIDTANLPAAAFSDDILFFLSVGVGFTSKKTLTLQNMGTAALNISDISLAGTYPSQFSFTDTCGSSVAAGSKCTIDVTFAPTTIGPIDATLVVSDDSGGTPHQDQVGLDGTGVAAPAVTLNPPTTLTFPDTLAGTTSSALQITVTNDGGANLNITSVVKAGTAYAVSGCATPITITPGNNCVISVTFSPTTGGIITGSVTITDNAPGSPRTVALTGTGIQPDFSMTTADDSETVSAGATASYTLTITPTNGFNQQVSFACTSGVPVRSTCQPPAAITPDGSNTPVAVTVNLVTQSRSAVPPGIVPFTAPPQTAPQGYLPWLVTLLLLALASLRLAGSRRRATVLLTATLFAALLWTACGGGGGGGGTTPPPKGTPAGDYNITITATSGSLSKQIVLKLHVN